MGAAARRRSRPGPAPCRAVVLAMVGFDLRRAVEEVKQHPASLQGIRVPADNEILQIADSFQAGQGQDEMRFGYYQVQINIIVAVQLGSAVKGGVLESMALEPELLEDPIRGDSLPSFVTRSSPISSFRVWLTEDWCSLSFSLRASVLRVMSPPRPDQTGSPPHASISIAPLWVGERTGYLASPARQGRPQR